MGLLDTLCSATDVPGAEGLTAPLDEELPAASPELPRPALLARLAAGMLLVALVAFFAYLGYSAVLAFTDAWVAPTNLSPDSDPVIRLNLEINRQHSEMERLRMAQARIQRDIVASSEARARLEQLRDGLRESFKSKLELEEEQYRSSAAIASNLKAQHALLLRLRQQQERRVDEARRQLEAGLIGRPDYEARQRELNDLELRVQTVEQRTQAAKMEHVKIGADVDAWSLATRPGAKSLNATPEVMTLQERLIQIELRLFDLETEERTQRRELTLNEATLRQAEQVLARLKQRPLYRATKASTDVAFIPYAELRGVSARSEVYACAWLIFFCEKVGRIAELLDGEVVAQDPSGEPTRGRYAILDLDEREAVREAALRVR